jgi:reactive chlorine resistance protein C
MVDAVQRKPRDQTFAVDARAVDAVGRAILRYGLVLFLVASGLTKFTEFEAQWIQPLLANSPFFAWMYSVTGVRGASNVIGVIELAIAALLTVRRWRPTLCAVGSLGAALMFLFTLSFVFTTPDQSVELTGFLMKDLILLGAALWSAGEALQARPARG